MSLMPRSSVANPLTAYPAVSQFPLKETEMLHHIIDSSPEAGRSVKEDLSEIKNSLVRKLRGVATLLALPNDAESDGVRKMNGIRSDFAEIGGKVKAGFSKILQAIPGDGEDYQASRPVGVTEDLLAFVKDLVTHPRTWVRFPLPDEVNTDDFAMNDAQQLHIGIVERHIPELGDLRWELCPEYLSEGRFWMIYFVLVHPKLDKYDALTLSSPQIAEARALMTQESKSRRKAKVKQTEGSLVSSHDHDGMEPSTKDVSTGASTLESASSDLKTQKHQSPSIDTQAPNKGSAAANDPKHLKPISDGLSEVVIGREEDDSDDWLNEQTPDENGTTLRDMPMNNEEEVSFGDLEEEDTKATKEATNNNRIDK